MSRQRDITREQVLCKLDDAKRRADKFMKLALEAKTAAEYDQYVYEASKAGYDYSVWYKVLAVLS